MRKNETDKTIYPECAVSDLHDEYLSHLRSS